LSELNQDQLTEDMATEAVEEPSEDEDTYHEFRRVVRIATVAKVLSWISLGVCVLLLVLDTFLIVSVVQGAAALAPDDPGYTISRTLDTIVRSLVPILSSGFFFVLLQATSEGIYILLDIEDNTRRATVVMDSDVE
jgi:hypothetical protein